jgi:hypothetical protein
VSRFALESCLLSAIAEEQGLTLSGLLTSMTFSCPSAGGSSAHSVNAHVPSKVAVSGLVSPWADESVDSITRRAAVMVKEKGYSCLKIKVARK